MNPITIIKYIKESIEILVDLKVQAKGLQKTETIDAYYLENGVNKYEKLIMKLEEDIRNHIRVAMIYLL